MATTVTDSLRAENKELKAGLATLQKSFDALVTKLERAPAPGSPNASNAFGGIARVGESMMGSRGFSYIKMLGVLSGDVSHEDAKIEMDMHNRLHGVYSKGQNAYEYKGAGVTGGIRGRFLAPLASSYHHEQIVPRDFRAEMKSLVCAGTQGADYDEMNWIRTKQLSGKYGQKAMSWLNELQGGALVAPPEQGELIELLRNKEALVNAGARTVPLPPQGRMKYPRQTLASNTYWVGENAPITDSTLGTGEVTLQAKKLAVLIKAPQELIRFASPAAEALMRDDMTKSLALGLDLAGLEGPGGDNTPRGIINMPFINRITSSQPGDNGDKIVAQDAYRMIASVEESNAEFETWIMRPKTLYKYYQLRADAIGQGDGSGSFLFNMIREAGAGCEAMLAGFPVVKSTQVSQSVSKGTSSNLTYILGGMFSDLLIGMFGAIEFAATTLGDTAFINDQTWVRGILSADIAARHEVSFSLMTNLSTTI